MRLKFVHQSLKTSLRIAATELLPKKWERLSEPEGNKRPKISSVWDCISWYQIAGIVISLQPWNLLNIDYLFLICILLGISPAFDCGFPTFRNPLSVPSSRAGWTTLHPALEDGTDRVFRKRRHTTIRRRGNTQKNTRFKTRRKFEIKNTCSLYSNFEYRIKLNA